MNEAYAQSLLELILQRKDAAELAEQINLIRELFEQNREYPVLLAHPSIQKSQKIGFLKESLGFADEMLLYFLEILMEDGMIAQSPEIFQIFSDLYEREQGISPFRISSAIPLTGEQKERLEKGLAKRFKKQIRAEYIVDPSLIGGLRIEGEGQIIDQSIPTRLQKMKEILA